MGRVGTSLAIGLAAALIVFGLVAAAARPVAGQPHLVSMAASAEAAKDYADRLGRSIGYPPGWSSQ